MNIIKITPKQYDDMRPKSSITYQSSFLHKIHSFSTQIARCPQTVRDGLRPWIENGMCDIHMLPEPESKKKKKRSSYEDVFVTHADLAMVASCRNIRVFTVDDMRAYDFVIPINEQQCDVIGFSMNDTRPIGHYPYCHSRLAKKLQAHSANNRNMLSSLQSHIHRTSAPVTLQLVTIHGTFETDQRMQDTSSWSTLHSVALCFDHSSNLVFTVNSHGQCICQDMKEERSFVGPCYLCRQDTAMEEVVSQIRNKNGKKYTYLRVKDKHHPFYSKAHDCFQEYDDLCLYWTITMCSMYSNAKAWAQIEGHDWYPGSWAYSRIWQLSMNTTRIVSIMKYIIFCTSYRIHKMYAKHNQEYKQYLIEHGGSYRYEEPEKHFELEDFPEEFAGSLPYLCDVGAV